MRSRFWRQLLAPGAAALWLLARVAGAQQPPAPGSDSSTALRLLDLPAAWIVVLIVLPLIALVSYGSYAREALTPRWKFALASLRALGLALLCLVLARPVLVERREETLPAEVLVLVDDSASMSRRDAYAGDERARSSLAQASGLEPAASTRSQLAAAVLQKRLLPELEQRGYRVELQRFSERAELLSSLAALEARGHVTYLGDALAGALANLRTRHLTDVLVVSDGRENGGLSSLDAARAAAAAGIPVHTAVVGDTRPERNAIVELIEAPDAALEGDQLSISVRVLGRGTAESPASSVTLEELDGSGLPLRTHDSRELTLSENGERLWLTAAEGPGIQGERRLRVSIPPLVGETMTDDNQVEFSVHVSPEKMRVLYVEGYPRWEYRYLALHLLKRSDENIRFQSYLLSATPDFPQESSRDLPPLRNIPTTRKELLDNYDVVILGDVNPYAVANDLAACEEFWSSLREFVAAGGGLLFEAGEYDNPRAFVGTPLEELLPVIVDPLYTQSSVDTTVEFRPTLEDPLNPHEIARLLPDSATNRELWEDPSGLRGFYWYFPVSRAKPGAQVVLRHPTEGNDYGRTPLLVAGYYPSGRTLFLGVDSTWRWRYNFGDTFHERFWRNAIRWLALGRLKSGDRRYRLESARSSYSLEERVVLEARVVDEDYRPSEAQTQLVHWSGPDELERELELAAIDTRPGQYRGTLEADRPGLYRAWIELDGERVTSTEFEVTLPSRERAEPAPDPAALAALSSLTRGRAVELSAALDLLGEFPGDEAQHRPISARLDDAWDDWKTLVVALLLLGAEWWLRKRQELV